VTREPIYAALLAYIQQLTSAPYSLAIPTISRGFKHWSQVPPEEQPAIYVVPEEEAATYERAKIYTRWNLKIALWVYVQKGDDITLGVQMLTAILDGIDAVLTVNPANAQGPPAGVNTLNGLVTQCAINGPTIISAGYLENQTVARVPIEIITA
jgi:hypothetical protein